MKKLVVTNLISEGVVIEGSFKSTSSLRIDGTLRGDIEVSSPHGIIVGPKGLIEGTIKSGGLIVLGKVVGNVDAENIEIRKGGIVQADIKYENLEIFHGGKFNGTTISDEKTTQIEKTVSTNNLI